MVGHLFDLSEDCKRSGHCGWDVRRAASWPLLAAKVDLLVAGACSAQELEVDALSKVARYFEVAEPPFASARAACSRPDSFAASRGRLLHCSPLQPRSAILSSGFAECLSSHLQVGPLPNQHSSD